MIIPCTYFVRSFFCVRDSLDAPSRLPPPHRSSSHIVCRRCDYPYVGAWLAMIGADVTVASKRCDNALISDNEVNKPNPHC